MNTTTILVLLIENFFYQPPQTFSGEGQVHLEWAWPDLYFSQHWRRSHRRQLPKRKNHFITLIPVGLAVDLESTIMSKLIIGINLFLEIFLCLVITNMKIFGVLLFFPHLVPGVCAGSCGQSSPDWGIFLLVLFLMIELYKIILPQDKKKKHKCDKEAIQASNIGTEEWAGLVHKFVKLPNGKVLWCLTSVWKQGVTSTGKLLKDKLIPKICSTGLSSDCYQEGHQNIFWVSWDIYISLLIQSKDHWKYALVKGDRVERKEWIPTIKNLLLCSCPESLKEAPNKKNSTESEEVQIDAPSIPSQDMDEEEGDSSENDSSQDQSDKSDEKDSKEEKERPTKRRRTENQSFEDIPMQTGDCDDVDTPSKGKKKVTGIRDRRPNDEIPRPFKCPICLKHFISPKKASSHDPLNCGTSKEEDTWPEWIRAALQHICLDCECSPQPPKLDSSPSPKPQSLFKRASKAKKKAKKTVSIEINIPSMKKDWNDENMTLNQRISRVETTWKLINDMLQTIHEKVNPGYPPNIVELLQNSPLPIKDLVVHQVFKDIDASTVSAIDAWITKEDARISDNEWKNLMTRLFKDKLLRIMAKPYEVLEMQKLWHKASKIMMLLSALTENGEVVGYTVSIEKASEVAVALSLKFSEKGADFKIDPDHPIPRKISIDMRWNGKNPELQVSIEFPEGLDYVNQSQHNVFPISIMMVQETIDSYKNNFKDLIEGLSKPVIWNGEEIKFNNIFSADMKAVWLFTGTRYKPVEKEAQATSESSQGKGKGKKGKGKSKGQSKGQSKGLVDKNGNIVSCHYCGSTYSGLCNIKGGKDRGILPDLIETPLGKFHRGDILCCTLHCKCRISEKILKMLFNICQGDKPACLGRINEFLQKKNVSFAIRPKEKKTTQQRTSIYNLLVKEATQNINSIRGDKIDGIFQDIDGLLDVIFPKMDNYLSDDEKIRFEDLRKSCKNLLEAWKALLPWLTHVDDELLPKDESLSSCLERFEKAILHENFKLFNPITPYVHYVLCHFKDLTDRHGNLAKFQNSGFEAAHKDYRDYSQNTAIGGRANTETSNPTVERVVEIGEGKEPSQTFTRPNYCSVISQYFQKFYALLLPFINKGIDDLQDPTYLTKFPKFKHPKYKRETRNFSKNKETPDEEFRPNVRKPRTRKESSSSQSQPPPKDIPPEEDPWRQIEILFDGTNSDEPIEERLFRRRAQNDLGIENAWTLSADDLLKEIQNKKGVPTKKRTRPEPSKQKSPKPKKAQKKSTSEKPRPKKLRGAITTRSTLDFSPPKKSLFDDSNRIWTVILEQFPDIRFFDASRTIQGGVDGACFFDSVLFSLQRHSPDAVLQLRKAISQKLKDPNDPDYKLLKSRNLNPETVGIAITKPEEWADVEALWICAKLFDIEFGIITKNQKARVNWVHQEPDKSFMLLYYHQDVHYESIALQIENKMFHFFAKGTPEWETAKEILKQYDAYHEQRRDEEAIKVFKQLKRFTKNEDDIQRFMDRYAWRKDPEIVEKAPMIFEAIELFRDECDEESHKDFNFIFNFLDKPKNMNEELAKKALEKYKQFLKFYGEIKDTEVTLNLLLSNEWNMDKVKAQHNATQSLVPLIEKSTYLDCRKRLERCKWDMGKTLDMYFSQGDIEEEEIQPISVQVMNVEEQSSQGHQMIDDPERREKVQKLMEKGKGINLSAIEAETILKNAKENLDAAMKLVEQRIDYSQRQEQATGVPAFRDESDFNWEQFMEEYPQDYFKI